VSLGDILMCETVKLRFVIDIGYHIFGYRGMPEVLHIGLVDAWVSAAEQRFNSSRYQHGTAMWP